MICIVTFFLRIGLDLNMHVLQFLDAKSTNHFCHTTKSASNFTDIFLVMKMNEESGKLVQKFQESAVIFPRTKIFIFLREGRRNLNFVGSKWMNI